MARFNRLPWLMRGLSHAVTQEIAIPVSRQDVYKRQIQEGAVLEKVLPEVQAVGLDNLEEYLRRKLAGHD